MCDKFPAAELLSKDTDCETSFFSHQDFAQYSSVDGMVAIHLFHQMRSGLNVAPKGMTGKDVHFLFQPLYCNFTFIYIRVHFVLLQFSSCFGSIYF